jgi:RNA polymerase sigma-32 factor
VSDKKIKPSSRGASATKRDTARKRTPRGARSGSAAGAKSRRAAGVRETTSGITAGPARPEPREPALVPEIETGAVGRFEDLEPRTMRPRPLGPAPVVADPGEGEEEEIDLDADVDAAVDAVLGLDDDGEPLEAEPGTRSSALAESPGAGPTHLPGGGTLIRLDPLGRYLAEVNRYAPLDREEELRLARLFRKTGDPEAAARLVTANLILVVKIARMFRRAVVNVLDLIQEGNVGLLHSLDRYDPELGVKFSTYASWWIKAYILKYLLDNTRLVRVGTTNARRKLLYNLNREKRRLEAAGFTAGPRLLAERFGVSERDVVDVEQALRGGDVPLDAPVGGDGATTRGDLLAAEAPSVEDEVARRELKALLDEKLAVFRAGLSEKEAAILDARLLADTPATLQEIGDRYGITREAVRQSEKRLTDRLREYLTEELGEEAVLQFRKR